MKWMPYQYTQQCVAGNNEMILSVTRQLVGRNVSRFQQLTSPTDTSLTGFTVIFSNTHHQYSPTSHFLHVNCPTPTPPPLCVHRPPQCIRIIELANSCCTFPHIKTLVTPKHMACPGVKCIRGETCVYETTSKT